MALLAAVTPALATSSSTVFTGGGRGLTADVAIQGAIDDAEVSASSEGLYDCALVGDPQVFEVFDDPIFGHVFYAQVDMACD